MTGLIGKQRQIGTIRTHMYPLKSTEGEETLKTEVKLTHLENPSQKPPNCSNTSFSLHFEGILKKVTHQTYSIFRSLYDFRVTKIRVISVIATLVGLMQ